MTILKEDLKTFILQCLEEKNADNISSIEIKNEAPLADYMIFASGRSVRNIKAIAEFITIELKHKLKLPSTVEGLRNSDWILLDAGEVILHLFHPEARERFKLEDLWNKK